jgi:hypothetical protein
MRSYVLVLSSLLSGCSFPLHTDLTDRITFDLGALGKQCSGGGTNTTMSSTTVHHESGDGTTCTVTGSWSGSLLDLPTVRQKVDEQLKANGKTYSDIDLKIDHVQLVFDDVQAPAPVTFQSTRARLSIASQQLFDRSGVAPAELGSEERVDLASDVVAQAGAQIAADTPEAIQGAGDATLLIDQASLVDVPDVTVSVQVKTSFDATVKLKNL